MLSTEFLDHLFTDFEPGQRLLADVRTFYGPSLIIERHDEPDGLSHFQIDDGGPTHKFRHAKIQLNTTAARTKAALMHELLHLSLPMRGFSLIQSLSLSPAHEQAIGHINSVLCKLVNAVQHDIFIAEFLRTGLPIEQFLGQTQRATANYKKEAKTYKGGYIPPQMVWYPQSWWSFEYINNYLAVFHGPENNGAAAATKETYKFGSRVLPKFDTTSRALREWVEAGLHRDAASYPKAMSDLMTILQMPQIKTFSKLSRIDGGSPQVEII